MPVFVLHPATPLEAPRLSIWQFEGNRQRNIDRSKAELVRLAFAEIVHSPNTGGLEDIDDALKRVTEKTKTKIEDAAPDKLPIPLVCDLLRHDDDDEPRNAVMLADEAGTQIDLEDNGGYRVLGYHASPELISRYEFDTNIRALVNLGAINFVSYAIQPRSSGEFFTLNHFGHMPKDTLTEAYAPSVLPPFELETRKGFKALNRAAARLLKLELAVTHTKMPPPRTQSPS